MQDNKVADFSAKTIVSALPTWVMCIFWQGMTLDEWSQAREKALKNQSKIFVGPAYMVVKKPRSKSSSKALATWRTAQLALAAKLFQEPRQQKVMAAAAAASNRQQAEEEEKHEAAE